MADPRFEIPWAPPDIGPGVAMVLSAINANRQHERSNAYLDMEREAVRNRAERESAAMARQKEQDDYNRQVAAFTAMPELQRRARKSIGAANVNPYGVTFSEGEAESPPSIAGVDIMGAKGGQYAQYAARALMGQPAEPEVDPGPTTGTYGYDPSDVANVSPARGVDRKYNQRHALDQDDVFGGAPTEPADLEAADMTPPQPTVETTAGPVEEETPSGINAAQAILQQPQAKRLYATYQGQRFEVPEETSTTGLGPEADALYQNFLASGAFKTPQDAMKAVLAHTDKGLAELGRTSRHTESEAGKNKRFEGYHMNVDQQFDKQGRALAQSEINARIMAGSRVAAARASQTGPLKVDTANRQDMSALRASFSEWKKTVNLAVDSKMHKRLATAMSNLDSGNAMQQREAAESLVSIFKGGGQVTKASQELLLNHLAGIVGDAQTWIQHKLSGHYGDAELQVLRQATRNALKEEKEKLDAYHESAVDTYGPGSGWEQLGGNVNHLVKGAFRQFGYEAPDIYQNSPESVVLGSGTRPTRTTAPTMIPIRNKKTGEVKQVTREEALRMGAIK